MNLLVVADTHIRNGDTGAVLPVLGRVADLAKKHDAVLVIAGDVFDVSRPLPRTIAEFARLIFQRGPDKTVVLVGNHDRDSDNEHDNALAPLAFSGHIRVIDGAGSYGGALFLPPAPRGQSGDAWFRSNVAEMAENFAHMAGSPLRVAIAHMGIVAPDSPKEWAAPGCLDLEAAFSVMKEHGVKLLLSGDWHGRRVFKRDDMTVIQIGALVPANRGETGPSYGFAYLVNDQTAEYRAFQLPGPRYYVTSDPIEAAELAKNSGARVTLRAPKGTPCPEGVDFQPTSTTHDRKHIDARAEAIMAGDAAIVRTVNEMVREDLRNDVLAVVRDLLASQGGAK